ncbi:hypothetical protein CCUS01_10142 [Colletotrichum cuscutae]|uniref:Uncharacterized protein n=1 Tax=Colletotrichum cuscutae TaxID=1209917 RepID=A0AAI9XQ78_9PEZI|nr:hypothetical protein CCUS01_10142 [Colletotrichum cuscutae]
MDHESADKSSLTHIWLSIDGWKGIQMAYLAYQQQGPVVGDIHVFSRFNFTAAAYLAMREAVRLRRRTETCLSLGCRSWTKVATPSGGL